MKINKQMDEANFRLKGIENCLQTLLAEIKLQHIKTNVGFFISDKKK